MPYAHLRSSITPQKLYLGAQDAVQSVRQAAASAGASGHGKLDRSLKKLLSAVDASSSSDRSAACCQTGMYAASSYTMSVHIRCITAYCYLKCCRSIAFLPAICCCCDRFIARLPSKQLQESVLWPSLPGVTCATYQTGLSHTRTFCGHVEQQCLSIWWPMYKQGACSWPSRNQASGRRRRISPWNLPPQHTLT